MKKSNKEIKITGIVQGVGFRPFIYTLAKSLYLNGWVNNCGSAVVIEVEGSEESISTFIERIKPEAPPLAHIKSIDVALGTFKGYSDFTIEKSSASQNRNVYISPDVSICSDCQRELFNMGDRRYLYPFINCTNCGPRFTIVTGVPYDRVNTTMNKFYMCDKCAKEYGNPMDRRYHAQPISCYECGPKLEVVGSDGVKVDVDDPIKYIVEMLLDGKIVAVKGLGGYHLVCDAENEQAVLVLRKRKIRDDKPFAIMARDYESAIRYCHISLEERKLLESEKKPIVLLKKREDYMLPEQIAPYNPYLGVMLPYTPIHLLLFNDRLNALVMTSGNRSSEPIYYKDDEAIENLCDIADYFLTNDRDIFIRTDDSVTRVFREKEYIIRRSRGYVPMPVTCEIFKLDTPSILACGGELKNAFCLNRGNEFYLSHHIGDLENAETLNSFEEGIEHFKKLLDIDCKVVAYDLHPEYLSTKYALSMDLQNKIAVQHHHAHIASCMAENNLNEDIIGVAFDGTGYGEDGHIWGGEFFTGSYGGFKRVGHLEYVKMPGGEMAIKEPWRMALSYLHKIGETVSEGNVLLACVDQGKAAAIIQLLEKNINSPLASSMGRLFDAVSALLGIRSRINYEGQAAIELERVVDSSYTGCYDYTLTQENESFNICVDETIRGIIADMKKGIGVGIIASKFHETITNIIVDSCNAIRSRTGLNKVALAGGVFQNITLLEGSVKSLEGNGFKVYVHCNVPSNDGGIALGQAAIAAAKINKTK
ncbi:MAG: carbamoyltransferase HypF [Clostridia bacterium]|nr:carbamoyltransferase HypF [Clostridia bacterium]